MLLCPGLVHIFLFNFRKAMPGDVVQPDLAESSVSTEGGESMTIPTNLSASESGVINQEYQKMAEAKLNRAQQVLTIVDRFLIA